jgi:hypothetical protein
VPCRFPAKFAVFACVLRVRAVQVASGDCRALQIAQENWDRMPDADHGDRTRRANARGFWRTQPCSRTLPPAERQFSQRYRFLADG